MNSELNWKKLRYSASHDDRQEALTIAMSLSNLEIQDELIDWFEKSDSNEIKKGLLNIIITKYRLKLLNPKPERKNKKDENILNLVNSIEEEELKEIVIEFFIIKNYIEGFGNSGILWLIKKYMDSKECGLFEARIRIEYFWIDNRELLI